MREDTQCVRSGWRVSVTFDERHGYIGSDVIEPASGLADVFPNRLADEFLEAAAQRYELWLVSYECVVFVG